MIFRLACDMCGPLVITPSGSTDGISTVSYSIDKNGCKIALVSCINPVFNYPATLTGFLNGGNYQLDVETNPKAATDEFTCQLGGTYMESLHWGNVFQFIFCTIPSNTPGKIVLPNNERNSSYESYYAFQR